jgi:single-strand DNA-binding protein
MKIIGLIRVGKDSVLKYTPSGDAVLNFSGAYSYGKLNNKQTQWIEYSLFGKRAESLQQYIVAGKQLLVYASDLHASTYDKKDGSTGVSIKARVDDIEFVGKRDESEQGKRTEPSQQTLETVSGGVDEFRDDIPF